MGVEERNIIGRDAASACTSHRIFLISRFQFFRDRPTVPRMKSAYELAMERLAKSDPAAGRAVTPAQKARLAELDMLYKGKIAEREIFLRQKLNEALAAGNADEAGNVRAQLAGERARLEEERDEEKEKARRAR
jgi:hypothetical protein